MHKPSFVGIGVQKCASTWIHRILEDHPQVFVSTPKEIDFFSYHYHFGFEWYEKHFPEGEVCGENSPSYFCDLRVPMRVRKFDSNMKIIVCLRDPVERLVSHHAHEVRLGHVDEAISFAKALQNNPMYVEQSMYAKYLTEWLSFFPQEQLLILLQEDIRCKPDEVAATLYAFLGVDTSFKSTFLEKKANPSIKPKFSFLESSLKETASFLRSLGLEILVKRIKGLTWIKNLRQKNMQDIHRVLPELSVEDIKALDVIFKPELKHLQTLTGLDLKEWPTWQRCFTLSKEE